MLWLQPITHTTVTNYTCASHRLRHDRSPVWVPPTTANKCGSKNGVSGVGQPKKSRYSSHQHTETAPTRPQGHPAGSLSHPVCTTLHGTKEVMRKNTQGWRGTATPHELRPVVRAKKNNANRWGASVAPLSSCTHQGRAGHRVTPPRGLCPTHENQTTCGV